MAETFVDKPLNVSTATSTLRRYLVVCFAVPVFLYLLVFAVIRIPSFERWGGSLYGPVLDYGFRASGLDADVVIFGDSSALYGISPVQMSQTLGGRVINLPNTLGSLPITEDMALRHYLLTNKKPRLIIFYFTGWNLDWDHDVQKGLIFEGEEMMARHGSLAEILEFARKRPSAVLLFPFQLYAASPKVALASFIRRQDRTGDVVASYGHRDANAARNRLNDSCSIPEEYVRRTRSESARALVARYTSSQIPVLFYIAPVPACKNATAVVGRSYAAVSARPPIELPPADFMGDAFYAHLEPRAVPVSTAALADAARSALRR